MSENKDQLLKSGRVSANDKASMTDRVAREIIAEEASTHQRKTDRLRLLRLKQESSELVSASAPKKKITRKSAE